MTRTCRTTLTPGNGIGTDVPGTACGAPTATLVRTGDLGGTTTSEFAHEALAAPGAHGTA
ncbi:hypothetical protein [Kocuria sabuli]|uniref:hypothetical protein n=1 Tax=Kocuria sabuli TaxID=3071448 RepID=UPI0034D47E1E